MYIILQMLQHTIKHMTKPDKHVPYYCYQGAFYRLSIIDVQIIPVTFSCKLFKIQMNSAVWPVTMKKQETLNETFVKCSIIYM